MIRIERSGIAEPKMQYPFELVEEDLRLYIIMRDKNTANALEESISDIYNILYAT